jgi:general secretion pathway protein N
MITKLPALGLDPRVGTRNEPSMRTRVVVTTVLALGALGGLHSSTLEAAIGQARDPLERAPAVFDATQIDPNTVDGASPDRAPASRGNPLWAIPLSTLSVTRERPLFSPSRRPRPPAVFAVVAVDSKPAPPPARAERPPLVLIGTIIGEARHIGIFAEEPSKKTIRLNVGEGHAGWILRAVNARDVRFENADRAAMLALQRTGQGPGPQATTTGAGPAPAAAPNPVGPVPAAATGQIAPAPAVDGIPPVHHRTRP